ncbi:MAG: thioredoxin domain-containing protein [Syntrophobacterales bacterium]|nr:MAG: thioredoxin domain-containing protein [Syntrophobacterales bacterium]
MLDNYPNQFKLVFKNFPLPNQKFAHKAATAALAAHGQGKFWEFHYKIFDNMKDLNDAKIQEIAEELELDMERFNRDMEDPSIQKLIARDIEDGKLADIPGVPTVFINGKLLKQRSLQGIEELIEAELKNEKR